MYRSYYGLKKMPFNLSPSAEFLWLGEKHLEALSVLEYGILEDKGFLLLTGDIGTGKTALINYLANKIGDKMIFVTIPNPNLQLIDFFNILADEFQMSRKPTSKGDFLIQFEKFLLEAHSRKTRVLIIIDEAQRINQTLLDEIRVLSNVELAEKKLLGIFFVGQSEFNDMIIEERNKPLRQRITIHHHLQPLSDAETESYIHHRTHIAGARDKLFTRDAISQIYEYSHGYPRLINILCDHALLTGYVRDAKIIGKDIIEECRRELDLPEPKNGPADDGTTGIENEEVEFIIPENRKRSKKVLFGLFFLCLGLLGYVAYLNYNDRLSLFYASAENAENRRVHHIISKNVISVQKLENTEASADRRLESTSKKATESPASTGQGPSQEIYPSENDGNIGAETKTSTGIDGKTEEPAKELPLLATESANNTEAAVKREDDFSADRQEISHLNKFLDKKIIVNFEYKSDELTKQAIDLLEPLIEPVSKRTDATILIEGYTDSLGGYAYNLTLSKIRAEIVKTYLVNRGVPPDRIECVGKGPENPLESNETIEGRAINRRVEVTVKLKK